MNHKTSSSAQNRKAKINARSLGDEKDGSGSGSLPPIVILHGLLGSSRNWLAAGKELGKGRAVYALDLPDHGESEWSEDPSFAEMSERIQAWADEQELSDVDWIGHSLGGKVALRIASDRPDLVRKLVLADIFPRQYPPHHDSDFRAMSAMEIHDLEDRKTADNRLGENVKDWGMRQFLLTNLVRDSEGGFRWQVNLAKLHQNLSTLAGLPFEEREPIDTPTLLIYGGASDFVRDEDLEEAETFFNEVRGVRLPDVGHNLHVEARDDFVRAVKEFLR